LKFANGQDIIALDYLSGKENAGFEATALRGERAVRRFESQRPVSKGSTR
jgi:hypothetical protein